MGLRDIVLPCSRISRNLDAPQFLHPFRQEYPDFGDREGIT